MKKNYLTYTICMIVFLSAVVLFLNFLILMPSYFAANLFSAGDVRAISYNLEDRFHYFNVQTQKDFLEILNQGNKFECLDSEHHCTEQNAVDIPLLTVHRFDNPKIHLVPVGQMSGKLVFHMFGLGNPCFIIEKEAGQLLRLLNSI